jgi:hypothetical protein
MAATRNLSSLTFEDTSTTNTPMMHENSPEAYKLTTSS